MTFTVGVSRDLLNSKGEFGFDATIFDVLATAAEPIQWELMPDEGPIVTPAQMARYDALYINTPAVREESFGAAPPRVRIVARHGVGFDTIDVAALTRRGVILTNTPEAIRKPVATMTITFILALAQRLFLKDRLTRTGRWGERVDYMGQGLAGRVLGLVGAGGIATETARLAQAFDMRVIATGRAELEGRPVVKTDELLPRAPLETVLRTADFVVLACPLDETSRGLIGRDALALMKPGAYLINVARGGVLDEAALLEALQSGRLAGAALDVFTQEPVNSDNPLLRRDDVIVTPHALCWTDQLFDAIARTALTSVADALSGRRPRHVVNPDALAKGLS